MNQPEQSRVIGYLQRPNSPKIEGKNLVSNNKKTSLSMSIGAGQLPSNFISPYRIKPEFVQYTITEGSTPNFNQNLQKLQVDLTTLSKQNVFLRQQNSQLKKQLQRLRKDLRQSVRSADKYSVSFPANNDLRGTIKRQMGEIKEMGIKIQLLSQQCQIYQENNEKLEERIRFLTIENKKSRTQVQELYGELAKFDNLKEKCNTLMKLYNNLESKFNSDQLEWMKWKQAWLSEKEYYYKRIQQLQRQKLIS